jgi:pimeloyl-ACP methyl ester carboxylesterase
MARSIALLIFSQRRLRRRIILLNIEIYVKLDHNARLLDYSNMIQSEFVFYSESSLHYISSTNGRFPLIFFHGFGQDHSMYTPLVQTLTRKYDVFVFDLYFHGKSKWGYDEQPLEKEFWAEIFQKFLTQQKIKRFSVAGFSLGGKFALATLEGFAPEIDEVFLLAPDGIKTSGWYSMATYPYPLRKFFKGMIEDHQRFTKLVNWLSKFSFVDKGLLRFAAYQMETETKRKRVYYSWVVFRHLTFDLKKLATLINENKIHLTVIVGKYDKVIVPGNMKLLLKHVPDHRFEVVNCGHSGLVFESLHHITPRAKSQKDSRG